MTELALTDNQMRIFLQGGDKRPMEFIRETAATYAFDSGLSISRKFAHFSDGFGSALRAESHFYKRAFDFPDLGVKGYALVFRVYRPMGQPGQVAEYLAGWVPLDRETDVDGWVAFLNAEIRDRLVTAGIQPRPPGAADGVLRAHPEAGGVTRIGDFRESYGEDDPDAPSILAAVGTGHRTPAQREAIAAYLRAAPRRSIAMGFSVDLLDPSQHAGSPSVRSDGRFAWLDTLAHYVALDDVALPAAFERHIQDHAKVTADPTEATQPDARAPSGPPAKAPRRLKMVGNFRELGFLRAIDGEPPPSFVAARGQARRNEVTNGYVARYLRGGWEHGSRMTQVGDVLDPRVLAGWTGLLTDGEYAWPQLLAHYVERHNVALPPAFEERMRKRMWSPPMALTMEGLVRP